MSEFLPIFHAAVCMGGSPPSDTGEESFSGTWVFSNLPVCVPDPAWHCVNRVKVSSLVENY